MELTDGQNKVFLQPQFEKTYIKIKENKYTLTRYSMLTRTIKCCVIMCREVKEYYHLVYGTLHKAIQTNLKYEQI